ncbi:MAG: hypothetical protein HOE45_09460 [Gammaproteobacteria bacterium]|nr:hypothetical protein [Gammaproteobacteria bacterium]MBT4147080.1 hypothetical protein [Gammaproteobacteria bacterium]MBT5967359.1 hypothetical protein [Gammaproteobacteria bacterium]MBT6419441.1 hypothetical protein [Gammaproteobacteria bacterium]MBT7436909.1 hypothetical protein [Gammaproteobacteria bacterium]
MTDLQKDIVVGVLFLTGLYSFISGAFIVSAVVFAASAIISNVQQSARLRG